jgi:DNA-directed RNA polymerase subunit RPC12/RpoP
MSITCIVGPTGIQWMYHPPSENKKYECPKCKHTFFTKKTTKVLDCPRCKHAWMNEDNFDNAWIIKPEDK